MYKKILIPLDGSELSVLALDYAKNIAGQLGSVEMVLFHVYSQEERGLAAMHRAYIERAVENVSSHLKASGQYADIQSGFKGVSVRGEVAMGHPVDKILSFTRNNDIDLMIMVTHGRSGLSRVVMGSVAHKVLLTSNVPIWFIRAGVTKEAMKDRFPIKAILVLLDGSKLAESVLPHVETLVKQYGAKRVKVVLLRVYESHLIESGFPPEKPPGSPPVISMGWEEHARKETIKSRLNAKAYLDEIAEQLKKAGLTVRAEVLMGDPTEKITSYLGKNLFSVVAMATHGRSGIGKLAYGSVAEHIILNDMTPFFLVRPWHFNSS